jgi:hypothetical protein
VVPVGHLAVNCGRSEWRVGYLAERSVVGARGATVFGCGSIVRFGRRSVWQAEWGLGVAVLVEPVLARRGDGLRRFRRRVLGRCGWYQSRTATRTS